MATEMLNPDDIYGTHVVKMLCNILPSLKMFDLYGNRVAETANACSR